MIRRKIVILVTPVLLVLVILCSRLVRGEESSIVDGASVSVKTTLFGLYGADACINPAFRQFTQENTWSTNDKVG